MSTGTLVKILIGTQIVLLVCTLIIAPLLPLDKWLDALSQEYIFEHNVNTILWNAFSFVVIYGICGVGILGPLYIAIAIGWLARKLKGQKK